jgi:nuclear transport factor 2 (NTF2) superfamily protein
MIVSTISVRHRTASIDGLNLFYREAGNPMPRALILLHGFPSSSHMFRDLIPHLADRFHVIAPDYIGFGQSDAPDHAAFTYSFDNLTRSMTGLIDHLDSQWRNRSEFFSGREAIEAFLKRKWTRELDYRLIKEVWIHAGNRIAVRFACEFHDDSGQWFRAYGNENWQFDAAGLMERRIASINEHAIAEAERKFCWPAGRRPDEHLGLTALGL